MSTLLVLILALALVSGQLIRIPFFTGGITGLEIAASVISLIGLIKLKFKLQKPSFALSAKIFILIAWLSLTFTPLHLSFKEYVTAFSYIGRFALYLLFSWVIFSNAFPSLKKKISNIFILSGLLIAVLGLIQLIFIPDLRFLASAGWDPHYFRTVSTFLDPNFTGAFLALTLILVMSLRGGSLRPTWQSTLVFALIYVALLTTFSRSSYLMFLVSGLAFSFLKKSKTFALATILLFVILLGGFQIYTNLVAEPRNIDREQSASSRLNTWEQGITLFQKSPALGIGFNAYRYGLKEYKLGDEQFLTSHGASSNDSSLLFVLATTGILGFLAYLYFLWTILKSSDGKNFILIAGLAGLLIHSLFANSLFYPPILAWILLISVSSKK